MNAHALLLARRLAGVAGFCVIVIIFQPGASAGVVQQLVIPLAFGICAWLILDNVVAVALAAAALSAVASNINSDNWITARAYPLLALVCVTYLAIRFSKHFRAHMASTRQRRREQRLERDGADKPESDTTP